MKRMAPGAVFWLAIRDWGDMRAWPKGCRAYVVVAGSHTYASLVLRHNLAARSSDTFRDHHDDVTCFSAAAAIARGAQHPRTTIRSRRSLSAAPAGTRGDILHLPRARRRPVVGTWITLTSEPRARAGRRSIADWVASRMAAAVVVKLPGLPS